MALLVAKWRRGRDSSLENTELTNGNIYVSTDTGRLHIDIDDARIEITDFIKTTEENILNTLTPLPKFYYATDTYRLWYYDNADGWCCLSAGTAEKIEADLNQTTKAYLVGLTESGTKPIYDNDVYLGTPEGSIYATTFNGYTLAPASTKDYIDNSTPTALRDDNTNLITERTAYNGLPSINDSHEYTSDTNIYAPETPGEEGQVLVSNGGGAPIWSDATLKSNTSIAYGTSSDESTTEKHVSIEDFSLDLGVMLIVTFETECDAGATINVSNTGSIPIYHMGSALRNNMIQAGATATFIFNGDHYLLLATDTEAGSDYSETSTVSPNSVKPLADTETLAEISSEMYATSTDTSTTVKTATLTDFNLDTGSIAVITFETEVDEGATLNISNTGAKSIIHMGDTLRNNMIQAGATAMFVYTGSQYLLLMTDTEAGSDYLESVGGGVKS